MLGTTRYTRVYYLINYIWVSTHNENTVIGVWHKCLVAEESQVNGNIGKVIGMNMNS